MDLRIRCDCGHEIRSSDAADLVERAQRHAREAHRMELPPEHLRVLAEATTDTTEPQGGERTVREQQ